MFNQAKTTQAKEEEHWNHPDDFPLKGSPREYESFIDSGIWFDMKETIDDRIEILTSMLLRVDTIEDLRAIQSEIKTLDDMKELPEYLMQHAKLEQETKED